MRSALERETTATRKKRKPAAPDSARNLRISIVLARAGSEAADLRAPKPKRAANACVAGETLIPASNRHETRIERAPPAPNVAAVQAKTVRHAIGAAVLEDLDPQSQRAKA